MCLQSKNTSRSRKRKQLLSDFKRSTAVMCATLPIIKLMKQKTLSKLVHKEKLHLRETYLSQKVREGCETLKIHNVLAAHVITIVTDSHFTPSKGP